MRLNQGLLPANANVNSGYMDMWHVTKKLILLLGLFLKEITRSGGGEGGAHKVRGWGKSTPSWALISIERGLA